MRRSRELLALEMFGPRVGERIAMLLERGREFSPRVSRTRMAASGAVLLACLIAGALLAPRWIAFAQEPLRFEVASVKLVEHPNYARLTCQTGRQFEATTSLKWLISFAYRPGDADRQIVGGPPWMDSRDLYFDVEAKPPTPPVSSEDCRKMVQTLLSERFKLALHKETREMPVYALVVGSKGSKLHEATGDEPPGRTSNIMLNGAAIQVNDHYSQSTARGMSMSQLAGFLQGLPSVGRLVVDETGLKGLYPITLDFATKTGDEEKPDVFTAVQEQLGLKLESKKEAVEVLVVDHAEKPDAN
jgi:uncharacterized protein (TIGR03435 family)